MIDGMATTAYIMLKEKKIILAHIKWVTHESRIVRRVFGILFQISIIQLYQISFCIHSMNMETP